MTRILDWLAVCVLAVSVVGATIGLVWLIASHRGGSFLPAMAVIGILLLAWAIVRVDGKYPDKW